MATTKFEAFSISHAAILNGATGVEEVAGDIYGVREGSLEVDTDSYDNTGDDTVLSSWFWFNFANLSITAGYIPFDLIALLSGSTVTSTGVAPADEYALPLWNEGSLNQPPKPVLLRIPSKDSAGAIRIMDIVLYKVQFEPIGFDGPSYKDGMLVNYNGKALMTDTDEAGAALTERAIGRLVNKPAA